MTKTQALYQFFSGFGISAYPSVPSDAVLPYLTYTPTTSAFLDGVVSISVQLWYKTDSEAVINNKADQISKALPAYLTCDNGIIWLNRDNPFSQPITNEDNSLKGRLILITAEYLTTY